MGLFNPHGNGVAVHDSMEPVLLCGQCGAENHTSASRCGFCLVDFRDVPPTAYPRHPVNDTAATAEVDHWHLTIAESRRLYDEQHTDKQPTATDYETWINLRT